MADPHRPRSVTPSALPFSCAHGSALQSAGASFPPRVRPPTVLGLSLMIVVVGLRRPYGVKVFGWRLGALTAFRAPTSRQPSRRSAAGSIFMPAASQAGIQLGV